MEVLSFFAAALGGSTPRQGGGTPAGEGAPFDLTLKAAVEQLDGNLRSGDTPTGEPRSDEAADGSVPGASIFDLLRVVETPSGWGFDLEGGLSVEEGTVEEGTVVEGTVVEGMPASDEAVLPDSQTSPSLPLTGIPTTGAPVLDAVMSAAPRSDETGTVAGVTPARTSVAPPRSGVEADVPAPREVPQAAPAVPVGNAALAVDEVLAVDDVAVEAARSVDRAPAISDATPVEAPLPVDAVSEADPRGPDRDLRKLEPELLTRLQRVVDRMAEEHGHRVELVEGYRSQERQNALFAQGRQGPGPVVTWTRDSNHTDGRAVDVRIDGGWDNPRAFARLQQIASEEGLVTLGMRDPGHLELPSPDGEVTQRVASDLVRPMGTRPSEGAMTLTGRNFAPVATPATPAQVQPRMAPVAPVARVAPVAGGNGSETLAATPAVPASEMENVVRPAAEPVAPAPRTARSDEGAGSTATATSSPRMALNGDGAPPSSRGFQGGRGNGDPRNGGGTGFVPADRPVEADPVANELTGTAASTRGTETDPTAELRGLATSQAPGAVSASGAVQAVRGTEAANPLQRLEQVMALQDRAAAEGPGWRVSMPDADGMGTRVQVGLRGRSVGARVDLSDPATARYMQTRVADLQQALETRGLDPETLFVRSAGEVRDPSLAARSGGLNVDALRALAGELDAQAGSHRQGDGREQAQREQARQQTDRWGFEDRRRTRDENTQPNQEEGQ